MIAASVRRDRRMIVHVPILVEMRRRYIVHMDYTRHMAGVGQAGRKGLRTGERE